MRTLPGVLLSAALTLSACGPSIQYHRDANVPVPSRATWAWSAPDGDSPVPRGAVTVPADSIQRLIADAIESELSSRGFARVPAEAADFIVHFHVGQRTMVDTLPPRDRPYTGDAARTPGAWGGYGRPEDLGDRVVEWEEGMLIVDVLPRDRRTVAWRGIIADEIAPADEREPAAAIRRAVRLLMRGFP